MFAVSDIHVDFADNMSWLESLSKYDHQDDVVILAGDVSHVPQQVSRVFRHLSYAFSKVCFVPGNHDLWVLDGAVETSLQKWRLVETIAHENGIATSPVYIGDLVIIPLLSWYDYSFGSLGSQLKEVWMDFYACKWSGFDTNSDVCSFFLKQNHKHLNCSAPIKITFSHFVPDVRLLPPQRYRYKYLDPVLGSSRLGVQVRKVQPDIHVYGHSHVRRDLEFLGVRYVNNALGYPREKRAEKALKCILEL